MMTHEEFDLVLEHRITEMRKVLSSKAKEYATEDRLHNFRESASLQGCSMERALLGKLSKHLVSLVDMMKGKDGPYALWSEKIGDTINYLVLLEAIVVERRGHQDAVRNGPAVVKKPLVEEATVVHGQHPTPRYELGQHITWVGENGRCDGIIQRISVFGNRVVYNLKNGYSVEESVVEGLAVVHSDHVEVQPVHHFMDRLTCKLCAGVIDVPKNSLPAELECPWCGQKEKYENIEKTEANAKAAILVMTIKACYDHMFGIHVNPELCRERLKIAMEAIK